jgi:hypothetical protein
MKWIITIEQKSTKLLITATSTKLLGNIKKKSIYFSYRLTNWN